MSGAPHDLPVSRKRAGIAARWLRDHFGDQMARAVAGGPFEVKHLCAIVCQETAIYWPSWIDRLSPDDILARCVFDASGDAAGTQRSAYPRNTAIFRADYGDAFTDMLIAEANRTRALRDRGPASMVYKGYGIFQYDLQHVKKDEAFFRRKQWAGMPACLERVMAELHAKYRAARGDFWDAIRRYNGRGLRAERYAANVRIFTEWCD